MPTRSQPFRPGAATRAYRVLRSSLYSRVARHPTVFGGMLRAVRFVERPAKKLRRIAAYSSARREGIDLAHVSLVRADAIEYSSELEFALHEAWGRAVPGEWDLGTMRFMDLNIVEAMEHVLVGGGAWDETDFYREVAGRVDEGETPWGCRTREDVDGRFREVETLFAAIRDDGYLSQSELASRTGEDPDEEVAVAVARDGRLLFSDGAHRLASVKLLGIDRVPVQIAARHPQWLARRRELAGEVASRADSEIQPFPHPDLESLAPVGMWDARLDAALSVLERGTPITVLGAGPGYLCHRLEDAGYECVAVEPDTDRRALLTMLRDAMRRRFTVVAVAAEIAPGAERSSTVLALAPQAAGAGRRDGLGAAIERLAPGTLLLGGTTEEDARRIARGSSFTVVTEVAVAGDEPILQLRR